MASTINEGMVISTPAVNETKDNEGLRIAHYRTLEELPGLVFGVLTLAYIVLSLTKLVL